MSGGVSAVRASESLCFVLSSMCKRGVRDVLVLLLL